MASIKGILLFGVARIALGAVFLWAFLDKWLGLGFSTCRDSATQSITILCKKAWINGGSPTAGFLSSSTHGPLASFFKTLTDSQMVEWLFMLGLLGIGTALILGVARKITTVAGISMMALMYASLIPPSANPLIDYHIIYILLFLILNHVRAGEYGGLGGRWKKLSIVKSYPVLE